MLSFAQDFVSQIADRLLSMLAEGADDRSAWRVVQEHLPRAKGWFDFRMAVWSEMRKKQLAHPR